MSQEEVFNPLDKTSLGESVAKALLERDEESLAQFEKFQGAGVYAIYYRGSFSPYQTLANLNRGSGAFPIYVGKAIPKGGRKGGDTNNISQSFALHRRIVDHANSVIATESLSVEDFSFRRLAVDDIWISLGESVVINTFLPLWNTVVEGFGNHDPGAGRYKGKRPLWDELHPGRGWAERCQPAKHTPNEILTLVERYMAELDQ